MTQKSILITGCSSGIGLDAARALARRGWRVFATCRKPADCARLTAEGLESFVLDHDDAATIAAAVTEATARTGGTLDAIFANAGFGMPVAVEDLPAVRERVRLVVRVAPHDPRLFRFRSDDLRNFRHALSQRLALLFP